MLYNYSHLTLGLQNHACSTVSFIKQNQIQDGNTMIGTIRSISATVTLSSGLLKNLFSHSGVEELWPVLHIIASVQFVFAQLT